MTLITNDFYHVHLSTQWRVHNGRGRYFANFLTPWYVQICPPRARSVLYHSWKKYSTLAPSLISETAAAGNDDKRSANGGRTIKYKHPLTLFEEKVASSRWRGANKHSSLYPSERSPSVRWPDPPGSSSGTGWSEEESVKQTRLPCNWVFSLM